ncbi:hypothetical protein JKP88DRAFT_254288 [Tribonema minus]|uniref:Fibronectin type-III domain-containing protein n=1 Tax=Tribonema minus TaxID=303371 RepID=A0A835ZDJ3_9STRA|nr:hypothetical protein JKP88DRAFT_254288 [Tribonema minus]
MACRVCVSSQLVFGLPLIALAALPVPPSNIVLFPDRDFVTVEGFQEYAGKRGALIATRGTQRVGAAIPVFSGGDVAFEVNHPGGRERTFKVPFRCSAAATWRSRSTTPEVDTANVAECRLVNTFIDTRIPPPAAATVAPFRVIFEGTMETALTAQGFLDFRIINPDWVGTVVGRRDVRAALNLAAAPPLVASAGYASVLEVIPGSTGPGLGRFRATFDFTTRELAQLAVDGGARVLSWLAQDAAAFAICITISEYLEVGGPGFGGCPSGPVFLAAPKPPATAVIRSSTTTADVYWAQSKPAPSSPAVTAYNALLTAPVTLPPLPLDVLGVRQAPAVVTAVAGVPQGAEHATIAGLVAGRDYTAEVNSITGTAVVPPVRISEPATALLPATVAPSVGATNALAVDASAPRGTAVPAVYTPVDELTLSITGGLPGYIFYTMTETSDAAVTPVATDVVNTLTGLPTAAAVLYTGPIPIRAIRAHLKWTVYKNDGSHSADDGGFYGAIAALPPVINAVASPTVAGRIDVAITATAPVPGVNLDTLKFIIQVTSPALAAPLSQEVPAMTTSVPFTGLATGTAYTFTARAAGLNGVLSAQAGPVTVTTAAVAVVDDVTITDVRARVGRFRVLGGLVARPEGARTLTLFARTIVLGVVTDTALGSVSVLGTGPYVIDVRQTVTGNILVRSSGGGQSAVRAV